MKISKTKAPLSFFGCGRGHSFSHNNAYFFRKVNSSDAEMQNKYDLFLIDLSMLNCQKAIELIQSRNDIRYIFLLITHLHDDHFSGVIPLCSYCYYKLNKTVNVIIHPNLKSDICEYARITGAALKPACRVCAFYETIKYIDYDKPFDSTIEMAEVLDAIKKTVKSIILTQHDSKLENKCFGFRCETDDFSFVYTGDTAVLEPFIPYIQPKDVLYIDVQPDYEFAWHLNWVTYNHDLIRLAKHHVIYCMHYSNADKLQEIIKTYKNIYLATPVDIQPVID